LVPYPAMLDVPHELVEHVSWLIYARRRELRSRWRRLGCFKQALLALAHLRKNETLAQLGAGFGVSEATAWRYVDETVELLAAWAPGLVGPCLGGGGGSSSSVRCPRCPCCGRDTRSPDTGASERIRVTQPRPNFLAGARLHAHVARQGQGLPARFAPVGGAKRSAARPGSFRPSRRDGSARRPPAGVSSEHWTHPHPQPSESPTS